MRLVKVLKENEDGLTYQRLSNVLNVEVEKVKLVVLHFKNKGLIDEIIVGGEPAIIKISEEGLEPIDNNR